MYIHQKWVSESEDLFLKKKTIKFLFMKFSLGFCAANFQKSHLQTPKFTCDASLVGQWQWKTRQALAATHEKTLPCTTLQRSLRAFWEGGNCHPFLIRVPVGWHSFRDEPEILGLSVGAPKSIDGHPKSIAAADIIYTSIPTSCCCSIYCCFAITSTGWAGEIISIQVKKILIVSTQVS